MSSDVAPGADQAGEVLDRNRIAELCVHIEDLVSFLVGTRSVHAHDAEEIVSSVFDKLLGEAAAGTPIVTKPGVPDLSFLKTLARNALHRFNDNRANRSIQTSSLLQRGGDDLRTTADLRDVSQRRPLSIIDARQKLDAATEAWNTLPELARTLIELVDFAGHSIRDAAQSLALPERKAYDLYEESKRSLERELGKTWSTFIQPLPPGEYKPRGRQGLIQHISDLPREHREVLMYLLIERQPEAQVAHALRLTPEELRKKLTRAEELLSRKTGCSVEEIRTIMSRP